jgi:hypothetical protein
MFHANGSCGLRILTIKIQTSPTFKFQQRVLLSKYFLDLNDLGEYWLETFQE